MNKNKVCWIIINISDTFNHKTKISLKHCMPSGNDCWSETRRTNTICAWCNPRTKIMFVKSFMSFLQTIFYLMFCLVYGKGKKYFKENQINPVLVWRYNIYMYSSKQNAFHMRNVRLHTLNLSEHVQKQKFVSAYKNVHDHTLAYADFIRSSVTAL